LGKIPENLGKTSEYLGKIPRKSGQNRRPTSFDFKKWRPTFAEKRPYLEVTSKTGLHVLCGSKCVGIRRKKNFSGKFGEIRTKILRTHKNLSAPTPMFDIATQKMYICVKTIKPKKMRFF